MEVKDLPENICFVSDSQEVKSTKDTCFCITWEKGKAYNEFEKYDSFFIQEEFDKVWGMYGIIPELNKEVFELI